MAPCLVMGQAAGTAAALAAPSGEAFEDLDVARLQQELRQADVWRENES